MALIALSLILYLLVCFLRPHWGIYAILALLPTYQIRFTIFGFPTTYLEWLILILATAVALQSIFAKEKRSAYVERFSKIFKNNRSLFVFVGIFLLAGAISIFTSPETTRALGLFKAYFLEGALFWLLFLLLIDSREKFIKTLYALGILIITLAAFGIFQFFTLYRLPPAWWGPGTEPRRIVSVFTYPNAVGLLITPLLAIFTSLLMFKDRIAGLINKTFLIWVTLLGVILLVLTFSRGAWLAYLLALIVLLFFSQYKRVVFGLMTLGLIVILIIPTSRNRLLPLFTGVDPASNERIKLYSGTWEIIKESPVLGAGLYGFREAYESVKKSPNDEVLNYPHNFFLNFWVETGLLGLLAVIAMLLWTLKRGARLYDDHQDLQPLILSVFAALAVLVIHGQVDAPFFKNDLAILFWFLLALIPTLTLLKQKNSLSPK